MFDPRLSSLPAHDRRRDPPVMSLLDGAAGGKLNIAIAAIVAEGHLEWMELLEGGTNCNGLSLDSSQRGWGGGQRQGDWHVHIC